VLSPAAFSRTPTTPPSAGYSTPGGGGTHTHTAEEAASLVRATPTVGGSWLRACEWESTSSRAFV
jgi:hypothetical protein